jgi:SNF2 family DNA or RNA helicase
MGFFDYFKRTSIGPATSTPVLGTTVQDEGVLLSFAQGTGAIDVESLLELSEGASTEEKLLRGYLAGLFVEDKCELTPEGVMIRWSSFYELINTPDHSALIPLLRVPTISAAVPILDNIGDVSDPVFRINVVGWMLGKQKISAELVINPMIRIGQTEALVSKPVHDLLTAIKSLNDKSSEGRGQRHNEMAWGLVRALAVKAGALFESLYLSSTIVITPETLKLPVKREDTAFGRVFTVEPTFVGAPAGWLTAFDKLDRVQDHYDITRDGGRIRVIMTESVKKVLEVVKREMPARKVSGSKAEMFMHNPQAFLGDYAEGVLDDNEEGGLAIATSFHISPNVDGGSITFVTLIATEFYADGYSQSYRETIDSIDALGKLTARIGDALGDGRQSIAFREFDLTLDVNAEVELSRMVDLLQVWRLRGDAIIMLDEIYEFDGYSDRIEGIGIAKPIYIPVLQKSKPIDEDDDGGGMQVPKDLTPVLKVILPGSGESVLVPLTREWVDEYSQKVDEAERSGAKIVIDPRIPSPLETSQARLLASGFQKLLGIQEGPTVGAGKESKNKRQEKQIKETLLVKSNFLVVDLVEDRNAELALPEAAVPHLPVSLRPSVKLKAHQQHGIAWFQHLYSKAPRMVGGCLLADDMGLGKTLQLLSVLGRLYEDEPDAPPSLILVPKTLLENWAGEIDKFFTPSFPPYLVLHGKELTARKQPKELIDQELKAKGIAELFTPNWIGSAKIVITTYDTLTGFEFSFARQQFSIVICDEAQRIKNPAALVSKAVRTLKAKFRVACTGTPVENTLLDLWCLFDFFQPGLLGAPDDFSNKYRKPIESQTEDQMEALGELQALIKHQTLRRTKKDIAADLPNKYFAISGTANERLHKLKVEENDLLKVDITNHQRVLYKGGLKKLQEARQEADGRRRGLLSFEALHFMKAVCAEPYCLPGRKFIVDPAGIDAHLRNSPKLAWLIDELRIIKAKKEPEKVIIFTELREVQTALHYFLGEFFNLKPFIVNGKSENRQGYIDRFSEKEGFDVIILSPLAAGAGLNVTAANHVFHFTRSWNPAKEAQATDRAFRIGQLKDVIVYCPTVIDSADFLYKTFEERLDTLLKVKEKLASTTIDGDGLETMLNGSTSDVKFTEFMLSAGDTSKGNEVVPRKITIDDVDRLDGESFEHFSSLYFSKLGFLSQVTEKQQGDGGIDVIGIKGGSGVLAQCKSSQSMSIGWDAIKEVVGGAIRYQARYPGVRFKRMAITNQTFNPTAVEQAEFNHVEVVERDAIISFLEAHPITDLELEELIFDVAV